MNFYKRYCGDYMRATGVLSLAQHGAYSLMLDVYYSTEKPLPKGKDLYRLLRCETLQEKKAVDVICKQFWIELKEGFINNRALSEIEKADKIREKNKTNGLKGGRPSLETDNPMGSVWVSQKEDKNNPSVKQHQTPDTRHQTKSGKPLSQDKVIGHDSEYLGDYLDENTGELSAGGVK